MAKRLSHGSDLTKTLEAGVSPDAFDVPAAPEGAPDPEKGDLRGRRKAPKGPPCRMCGLPLPRGAESAIGVHIRCVADARFKRIVMPRPQYGRRR